MNFIHLEKVPVDQIDRFADIHVFGMYLEAVCYDYLVKGIHRCL